MSRMPGRVRPAVGDKVTAQQFTPTEVQLFRFSATTGNPHRIHFDKQYAEAEGYRGVLVQSHLHAAYLAKTVCDWAGPEARLAKFSWRNLVPAVPGDVLTCRGEVIEVSCRGGMLRAVCALTETKQDGQVCAPGEATIEWPLEEEDASD